jgi:hypothetical protein
MATACVTAASCSAFADSAFAFACNSHGDPMVAAGASIEFLAPTPLGERIIATATEVFRARRHGIYDVAVTAASGCRARTFPRTLFAPAWRHFMNLQSYVRGAWHGGGEAGVAMRDASTGEVIAHASSAGLDFAAVLEHAREVGGPHCAR